ncbi:MAG: chloride channel protein [Clostridia bacterium]|nr:chloride channel protein [Clostridia bacterium]
MGRFLREQGVHLTIFFKWVLGACGIGLLLGAVGAAFYYGINLVTDLRAEYPWLLYLLPAAGVVIVLLYRWSGMQDKGTNFVLIAVKENEPMRLRTAPLIFLSTILTHLGGGSSGREGAALQIGASISSRIGYALKLEESDTKILVVCGMAAAFSALFGTPITAAVFAMEVVHVGVMHYSAIVPCVLSSLVASGLAGRLGVVPESFRLGVTPPLAAMSPLVLAQVAVLAIACAFLAILFCKLMHAAPGVYQRLLPNPILRVIAGGALVILLTLLVGSRDYNGAGSHLIHAAINGEARPEAFLLKMLFTTVTLGAGFKGGEIVPVFFTGATFGCVAAPLLGLDPSLGAAVGMVAVFCGVTNCPLSSILLSVELFGGQGLPLFALACAVSYMLSGYIGLYTEQEIVYSKLKPVVNDWKNRNLP